MILEDYVFEKLLEKGCFDEVYLTTKNGDPKKYATKIYDRQKSDEISIKKFMENEFIMLNYLNHPNIVKLKEAKKTKKHYYLIFEYCNGGKLSKALEEYMKKFGKPFPEEIVQHFMKQIIDAFKYMHEKKIIHRFITLDNILLNYENEEDAKNLNLMKAQIKIIDFFFACKISEKGLKYSCKDSDLKGLEMTDPIVLQKILFAQRRIRELGNKENADIWLIGDACFEMLIGRPIFDALPKEENSEEFAKKSSLIPTSISYEVISFINGMLQYNGSKRLTAAQLIRHDFLCKDVNEFKKMDLEKVSNMNEISDVNASTIWCIFQKKYETLICQILGIDYIKPIDKKEEAEFTKIKEMQSSVKIPSKGIPDNPTAEKILGMSKEDIDEMKKDSNDKEVNYVFDNNIFNN